MATGRGQAILARRLFENGCVKGVQGSSTLWNPHLYCTPITRSPVFADFIGCEFSWHPFVFLMSAENEYAHVQHAGWQALTVTIERSDFQLSPGVHLWCACEKGACLAIKRVLFLTFHAHQGHHRKSDIYLCRPMPGARASGKTRMKKLSCRTRSTRTRCTTTRSTTTRASTGCDSRCASCRMACTAFMCRSERIPRADA